VYNPCDARIECFGIELAIRNNDLKMLKFLWNEQKCKWEAKHFAYILDRVLEEHWEEGI
jgi:hypothetical protein